MAPRSNLLTPSRDLGVDFRPVVLMAATLLGLFADLS